MKKIAATFLKTFRENVRDWKILILVILFAPLFVFMMNAYFGHPGASAFAVALLNLDESGSFAGELIAEWGKRGTDGQAVLKIIPVRDAEAARKMVRDKKADLFVTIPVGFSDALKRFLETKKGTVPPLSGYGDQTSTRFMMAASLVDYAAYAWIGAKTGTESPLLITYENAGVQKKISEFDLYIPAMLVLSIIMILFSAGASIIREVEKGTITRLSLSKLGSFEFITSLSLNQIVIGIASLLLTLLAALSIGYRPGGSLLLLMLIGIITGFSVISIGIITSCFMKNMFGLLTVGCFPFFTLMFFSDCFMPLPKVNLMTLFGFPLYLNDILPTATATRALNKVLNFNSGFADIGFELAWMVLISAVYFTVGVFLFRRKYKWHR